MHLDSKLQDIKLKDPKFSANISLEKMSLAYQNNVNRMMKFSKARLNIAFKFEHDYQKIIAFSFQKVLKFKLDKT